ncbi:hypothetical protein F4818DRAFT_445646 [Hypoxylon cercidicola]|nr:hypothetical protein F4818DRAFT_445646 [Hypoxylon cercidicola]
MEKDQAFPTVTNVNSSGTLSWIDNLHGLPTKPPSIFLDAERFNDGKITFLHLFIPSKNTIYRVQIDGPRSVDLSTKNSAGVSLTTILQSEPIPKVVFDVRGISKALFDQHNISLDGIRDLQLMELASRDFKQSKKYVAGFAKCVDTDIPKSNEVRKRWLESDNVDESPLFNILGHAPRSSMRRVEVLPTLWSIYNARLHMPGKAFWLAESRWEAKSRIKASQKPGFNVSDKKNALGPEDWYVEELREARIDDWNDELMMELRIGDLKLDEDAFWVPIQKDEEDDQDDGNDDWYDDDSI